MLLYITCNKGCGVYYPVYGMANIKDPLLIEKSSLRSGGNKFSFFTIWAYMWASTTGPMPYKL